MRLAQIQLYRAPVRGAGGVLSMGKFHDTNVT